MESCIKQVKLIKKLKVIVVDDHLDSRDLVEMYLQQKQAEVKTASSAEEAIALLNEFQPELIVSDIYMPQKDGFWLIEQLHIINQKSENYISAIAITAAAKEEEKLQILAAGYDGYLAKPFLFEDLTDLINRVI